MTTPTRPFDAGSVIDQILTGHLTSASVPAARPGLSTSESAFVDAVSDWCARQDLAVDIESNGQVPDKVLAELHELGALRIIIPQRYGGLGFSDTCLLAVLSVLTTAHASVCEIVAAHQVIGAVRPLIEFGTEHQRARYLPELLKQPSAFALNEPDLGYGAGPLQTTARFDTDTGGYRVTGTKTWITNATITSHAIVLADLTPTPRSSGGVTALLIKADDPGVTRGPRSTFAGLRGLPNGRLHFQDTLIPADRVIGGEGNGIEIALSCLGQCRAALPVACLTTTIACLRQAEAWAHEDRQTRRGLHTHPQIQRHLAGLLTDGLIANAVTWFALDPHCASIDSEAAKLVLSETASHATDTVLQLVGGRGYETAASARERGSTSTPIERLWRDTRVTRIFDSSTEMLKDLIAQPLSGTGAAQTTQHPSATASVAALSDLAVRIHRGLTADPDNPWVRATAVDSTLDLFTLVCLHRYQQHLGEDREPTTAGWEVAATDLHERVERSLHALSDPAAFSRRQALATEITSTTALSSPFTHTLTGLGVRP